MTGTEIFAGALAVAALFYFVGRYQSRQKLLRGRHSVSITDIVNGLPSNIDRDEAEIVLQAIGKSFGLQPEFLQLDDSIAALTAMDSWMLGKGQEELEQWLRANGVTAIQPKPNTIRDLLISVLPLKTHGTRRAS